MSKDPVEQRTDELLQDFLEYLEDGESKGLTDNGVLFQQWVMQKSLAFNSPPRCLPKIIPCDAALMNSAAPTLYGGPGRFFLTIVL